MRTERVMLRHAAAAPAVVALREPSGRDEIAVDGVDTRSAVALLDRLLRGSAAPTAMQLAAPDRDALLAALHRQCWGDRIVTTLTCSACASKFSLSFELSAVQRHLAANDSCWRADGNGRVVDDAGTSFKVPRAEDELAVVTDSPREAAAQLALLCGAGPADIEAGSAALEQAAPIIDLELTGNCVECGREHAAHFDLQSFLLQRLINERESLLAEIHILASAYGWSLRDILSLARSTRRGLAATISEAQARSALRREARR